jgi:hypothetical protein
MRQPTRPNSSDPNVAGSASFCTRCGGDIVSGDRTCRTCGADTIDANLVTLLKRTSARRSARDGDRKEDRLFPF